MLSSLLGPEARLVFACIGDTPDVAEVYHALESPIDWESLCLILERESAAMHVWRMLAVHRDRIPEQFAVRLHGMSRDKRFAMLRIEQRLHHSVAALHKAGIPCVLLKGAALASGVYASFADRPMRDIDLLVRPNQVEAALEVLLANGWYSPYGIPTDGSLDHTHHLPALVDAGGLSVVLELHRNILTAGHPFALNLDEWWERASPVPRGPLGAHVFSPEHLLLHACIHLGYHHLFRQGAWRTFRDIARIVTLEGFSWRDFTEAALQSRAATSAYWVLRLGQQLGGIDVPDDVLRTLAPPHPEFVKRALERHLVLVLTPGARDCPSATVRRVLWSAAILPTWSGHNSARPWTLANGPIGAATSNEATLPIPQTVSEPRRSWSRYLSAVAAGR